jgi:hypothetical protein
MIKTMTIFRNIRDTERFLTFYESIFPEIHRFPGIIQTNVTRIYEDEQNESGIQFIFETLYESEIAFQRIMELPKAIQLMDKVNNSDVAEFYFFVGQEEYIDLKRRRNNIESSIS